MSHRIRIATGATVLLAALSALPADARYCRGGFDGDATYTLLKAGGYGLSAIDSGQTFDGGLFLGAESGVSLTPHLEFGLTIDWFHRERANTDVLLIDSSYDLPIEGRVDLDGTSTDLVPLGAGLRVRFPVGDGRFAPFVSGQLTYDFLRLTSRDVVSSGDSLVLSERTEWFSGPGGTVTLGVEAHLDPRFGVLIEAGAHGSEPSKELIVDGTPVRGHVVTDGEFARVGLRVGF